MAAGLNTVARNVLAAWDLYKEFANRETIPEGFERNVHMGSTCVKTAHLGLTVLRTVLEYNGVPLSTLSKIDTGRLLTGTVRMATDGINAIGKYENGPKDWPSIVKAIQEGVVVPLTELIITAEQADIVGEKQYIEDFKNNPNAERPIYEEVDCGDYTINIIVGHRPIDLQECLDNIQASNNIISSAISLDFSARIVELYESLTKSVRINPVIAAMPQLNEEINLRALNRIPEVLQQDQVFRTFTCAITHECIRHPVKDPNGITYYERDAILAWINQRGTSPVTGLPLGQDQLIEAPAVSALINRRLDHYQERLDRLIAMVAPLQRHEEEAVIAAAEAEHGSPIVPAVAAG